MSISEYNQRMDRLYKAVYNWQIKAMPDKNRLNHVLTRCIKTLELWYNRVNAFDNYDAQAQIIIINARFRF